MNEQDLTTALGDPDWRVRRRAVETLLRAVTESSLSDLVHKLRREHRDASVLNSLLEVLVSLGPRSLPSLIELTTDADAEVRMYAALALGDLKEPHAIPALSALLRDPDPNVQYHAIEALAKLKAAEAADAIADIALSSDFFLAFPAVDALAAIGEARVAPRLLPLLQDSVMQPAAIAALADLGDEAVVPVFAGLLNQPSVVPSLSVALLKLHHRYQALYVEGEHIEDLVRQHAPASAAENIVSVLDSLAGDTLRATVLVLGWVGSGSIISELPHLLGREDVRHEVIETFVRYGKEVVGTLCEQLKAEDVNTRRAAVSALARIGDRRSVPFLVKVLSDSELTVSAAEALSKIGDDSAYGPLRQLLGHERAAVRHAAVAALNSIGYVGMPNDIAKLLFDANPNVRESAVRIAAYFGYPDAVTHLLDRIHDVNENVRRAALESLAYLDDDRIFEVLARACRDESPNIRSVAVQALGRQEDRRAIPELLRSVKDEAPWVRYQAVKSLGLIGSPDAIDSLALILRDDEATHVRIAAAEALGRIGGARIVSILAPFTDAENRDLAKAVLDGLGVMEQPDARQLISSALESNDVARRLAAVAAIGRRRDDLAISVLHRTAVSDSDADVSQEAISQLAAIATPFSIASLVRLTANRRLRDMAINLLAQLGPEHLDRVAAGLNAEDVDVRISIVHVLARMKSPRASELLVRALNDAAAGVREAAITALKRIGNRNGDRKLVEMFRTDPDPYVREAARKALER